MKTHQKLRLVPVLLLLGWFAMVFCSPIVLAADDSEAEQQPAPSWIWVQDPWTGDTVLTTVQAPDYSLWNRQRVVDYEESLKAEFAPPLGIVIYVDQLALLFALAVPLFGLVFWPRGDREGRVREDALMLLLVALTAVTAAGLFDSPIRSTAPSTGCAMPWRSSATTPALPSGFTRISSAGATGSPAARSNPKLPMYARPCLSTTISLQ